ncbi:glycosyltransferase [Candidatus Woesearchaeota archaeon]|nr:glycosyltransferase [Candidatus Woesearchaeota archaeon]
MTLKANADYLFETSWEVCNKVGGIYTVITSKIKLMSEYYTNYIPIGPYVKEKAKFNFKEEKPDKIFAKAFKELEKRGVKCYYGKWLTSTEPITILVDFQNYNHNANNIKKWLYEKFGIDSMGAPFDFDEPIVWSYCVGLLLELVSKELKGKKAVLHCHEWMAGVSGLYLKSVSSPIKTVFTTHATMLGRAIAGSGSPLYDMLEGIDAVDAAYKFGVKEKFFTEKACANNFEVFTTVSEITGMEAEKLLGKKPDVLVLNGLDVSKFPTFEEASVQHHAHRERMREFIMYYFFPYYTFDIEQSLAFFIMGRNEFRNKGFDIFIKSLGRLNEQMKKEKHKKTIVTFFWMPLGTRGTKTEVSQNKISFYQLHEEVKAQTHHMTHKIIQNILTKKEKIDEDLITKDFLNDLNRLKLNFEKDNNPPLCSHNIGDESNNETIKAFYENGLLNRPEDCVKVILYPVYLTGVDGLLDLSYYEAINACHFGVFPSYYEPWGYTPLESAAMGVPALTTDLAGFGQFIKSKNTKNEGIFVLDRYHKSEEDQLKQFTSILHSYATMHRPERVKQKIIAKNLSTIADWRLLIKNYIDAHNLALTR